MTSHHKDGNRLGKRKAGELTQGPLAGMPGFDGQGGNVVLSQTEYHGPIPHPAMLAQYERIHAGLANRIVEMAEQQSAHRRELERQTLEAQIADSHSVRRERRLGQIVGGVIVLGALAAAVAIAVFGSGPYASPAAGVLGSLPLCGLAAVFITGKVTESKSKSPGSS